jgi:putative lipoic acid-binding regulatory protein
VVSSEALLEFPCDYPLKVIGRPDEQLRARVQAIVARHVPDVPAVRISERLSAKGNFLSFSYLLPATSREQVEALVAELRSCEGVMMLV